VITKKACNATQEHIELNIHTHTIGICLAICVVGFISCDLTISNHGSKLATIAAAAAAQSG
jgi:hypothetical protein